MCPQSYPPKVIPPPTYINTYAFLVNQYPQATRVPNDKGKIPLHYAAREGRTEMVHLLLRADPTTASIRSKKDKLALHFACGEGHLEVVRALLSADPNGASLPSKKGKLPLHFAARWGHIPVAQHLLHFFPQAVTVPDWDGSLPLHDAAREGQCVMSQFLIDKWPEALQTTSLRGEIPLFSAVRSGNLSLVVCFLKAWYKGGTQILKNLTESDSVEDWDWNIVELCLRGAEGNFMGCPMLNLKTTCEACHQSCDQEVTLEKCCSKIRSLDQEVTVGRCCGKKRALSSLSLSKKRLRAKEETETDCLCAFFPIHAALRADVNARILRVVLDKSGQDLTRSDCVGALPIHVAVTNMTDKESIQLCLDEILTPHPEATKVRDKANRLPLHRALECNADFAFVKALVETYPKSVLESYQTSEPKSDRKSPLVLAIERDCDLSTIFFLLQSDPSFLKQALDEK